MEIRKPHPLKWYLNQGLASFPAGRAEVAYLNGVAATLLILALTQQAVGLHIMARHWHGLHDVKAVAENTHGSGKN